MYLTRGTAPETETKMNNSDQRQLTVRSLVLGVIGSVIITMSSMYIALRLSSLPWPIIFVALASMFSLKLMGIFSGIFTRRQMLPGRFCLVSLSSPNGNQSPKSLLWEMSPWGFSTAQSRCFLASGEPGSAAKARQPSLIDLSNSSSDIESCPPR